MKVTLNLQPMLDALDAAHDASLRDTLASIQREQKRLTGELAGSFYIVEHESARAAPGQFRARKRYIVSGAPHADAVEHGAWTRAKTSVKAGTRRRGIYQEVQSVDGKRKRIRVGWEAGPLRVAANRRGPHMKGNGLVARHADVWLEHMGYRLRGGNYSGRGRA